MDYSVEYVKMCEAAVELQEIVPHREITQKDFFAKKPDDEVGIWLPRQDQVQDMIIDIRKNLEVDGGNVEDVDNGRNRIGTLVEDLHATLTKNPSMFTLEQASLCLFMKEINFKSWNIVTKVWEEL